MERASSEHPAALRRRQTDGAPILVVEDNDDFRLLLEMTLRHAGYRVDCAASSEDAIRLLRERVYRLVLSDYSLPGLSGAWLISQAAAVYPHGLPSMIITGDPDAPGIPQDVAVVGKPVDFDRLLTQIRTLLAASPTASVPGGQRPSARNRDAVPHLERLQHRAAAPDDSASV